MSRVEATPAELAIVQEALNTGRGELMKHALQIVERAGFNDREARALALMALLIGAAQRYALSENALSQSGIPPYSIFKALCADMSRSSAHSTVTRGLAEMGPEAFGGTPSIIRPGG